MKKLVFFSNKYYLMTLILVILIFVIFAFFNYTEKVEEEDFFLNKSLNRLQSEVDVILNTYNIAVDAVYNNVLDDPEIKRTIYYGWEFENHRDNYRLFLESKLEPLYEDLKKYYVRQLHFHFKDGTSFLRMHRPEEFGDNLFKFRESVKYVNTEKKKFVGFEYGRIFNGYRYIYPLSYNGEHIGSVEFSLSFSAVTELLKNNLGGSKTFMIRTDLIKDAAATEEKYDYRNFSILEDYSFEQEVYNNLLKSDSEVSLDIIRKINRDNLDQLKEKTAAEESFIVYSKVKGKYYTGSFINIKGIDGETKAYLISYQEEDSLKFINRNFLITIIISFIFLIMTIVLLTIIFSNNNRLRFLAHNDQLTEISNRHHLTQVLEREYDRSQRYDNTFSLIIFDIDHFKSINDTYGHNTGDRVLKELSDLINENIRKSDYFGRWGGEEFVVIAVESKLQDAEKLTEKLRKIIEEYNFIEDRNITASFGVAEINEEESVDLLIKRADDALYKAKENGRNRVELG